MIGVARDLVVGGAIDFDDEFRFAAYEVNVVATNRSLTHKLVAVEAAVAEVAPKAGFGRKR